MKARLWKYFDLSNWNVKDVINNIYIYFFIYVTQQFHRFSYNIKKN